MSKPPLDMYDLARFFSKVEVRDKYSCWYYRGKKSARGYGGFGINNTTVYAHRLSYEIFCSEIDPRHVIRHKCDNPSCVNPWHLSSGTHLDNMLDRKIRGRNPAGSKNGRSKLTDEMVLAILADPRSAVKVAKDYGVGKETILRIRNGLGWTHITKGVPVAANRGRPVVPARHLEADWYRPEKKWADVPDEE